MLDSYDSFVFNLVQYLGELGADPIVHRNDALDVDEAMAMEPDGVLLSPGPGRPEHAGIICVAVPAFAAAGHAGVRRVPRAAGDRSRLRRVDRRRQRPDARQDVTDRPRRQRRVRRPAVAIDGTRYHSLTIDPATLPDTLEVTATTADGTIMGARARDADVEGVQFHPESVLTASGHDLLRTWLARCA